VQRGQRPLAVLAVTSLAWLAALGVAPMVRADSAAWPGPFAAAAGLTYVAASKVCHQRPERSFHVGTAPLPVCGRCTGLHAGVGFGLVIALVTWPGVVQWAARRAAGVAALAVLPSAASIGLEWMGGGLPMWTRTLAALPVGIVVALLIGAWLRGGPGVKSARREGSATLP
jgi:uncharacterized membrane protein